MKKLILISLLMMLAFDILSQDVIYLNSGERIKCKVTNVDSLNIYFIVRKYDREENVFINKSSVKNIDYGTIKNENLFQAYSVKDYVGCITVGILQGGGSLVGGDLELKLVDRLGIQIGAGIVGFGAGLNFHLKPTIRSSFISLQYWHQGVGDSYTQSLLGPNFVYRGKKWFSAQLGIGFTLENGPGWPESQEPIPVMLTYAIGIYFPLN
jgi:hypothetical protein